MLFVSLRLKIIKGIVRFFILLHVIPTLTHVMMYYECNCDRTCSKKQREPYSLSKRTNLTNVPFMGQQGCNVKIFKKLLFFMLPGWLFQDYICSCFIYFELLQKCRILHVVAMNIFFTIKFNIVTFILVCFGYIYAFKKNQQICKGYYIRQKNPPTQKENPALNF